MSVDARMLWIRNLGQAGSAAPSHIIEAELATEVPVHGLLDYADSSIICGPSTHGPSDTGLYKHTLRLRIPQSERVQDETDENPWRHATPKGYLFPSGPVGELAALFSVSLQTRFFVMWRSLRGLGKYDLPHKVEYTPLRVRLSPDFDPVIFSKDERNFTTQVGPFLMEIQGLPDSVHLRIAVATNHYLLALREIGIDEEMVFVRLVSAIECLATDCTIPDDPLLGKSLEDILRVENLNKEQADEARNVFKVRRAKLKFITFLMDHSTGFFDSEPREPAHTQVTPESLRDVSNAIYNARSGYLHNGDPMYLSLMRDVPNWHMDPSLGMIVQGRSFDAKQKLPRADFFHRLVRHCLREYIRRRALSQATSSRETP